MTTFRIITPIILCGNSNAPTAVKVLVWNVIWWPISEESMKESSHLIVSYVWSIFQAEVIWKDTEILSMSQMIQQILLLNSSVQFVQQNWKLSYIWRGTWNSIKRKPFSVKYVLSDSIQGPHWTVIPSVFMRIVNISNVTPVIKHLCLKMSWKGILRSLTTVYLSCKHKCHVCQREMHNPSNLKLHIPTKHEHIREFKCDICGKFFTSEFILDMHKKEMHKQSLSESWWFFK